MTHIAFVIILLAAVAADICLPYAWGMFWKIYHPLKIDTLILSDPDSPVCWIQRVFRFLYGLALIFGGVSVLNNATSNIGFDIALGVLIIVAGSLCGIVCSVLSLTDIKYVHSGAAKLHNILYIIGSIAILLAGFVSASTFFENGVRLFGSVLCISSFVSIFFFIMYLMSDRSEMKDTIISFEGLWEFLFKITSYFPIGAMCIGLTVNLI